jgi:uncharacterized protein (DUF305 family)
MRAHDRMIALLWIPCAIAILTSCSAPAPALNGQATQPSSTAEASLTAEHNDADVAFAQNMLTHNAQTTELLALMPVQGSSHEMARLAGDLANQNQIENQAFSAWLLQWGEDPHSYASTPVAVPGMVDTLTIDSLKSVSGAGIQGDWLKAMIPHAQGAVAMALAEVKGGQNTDVVLMAKSMIRPIQLNIDQMNEMLDGLEQNGR